MSKRFLYLLCMALACAVFVAACGEDEDGGGGSTGGSEETGATEGAKAIDPASMEGASGDVTYCLGKDTSGDKTAAIKRFNEQNPDMNAKLLEFSTSADEQRTQFVQRQEAKSGECDVFYADVIWTAEFAQQRWLYDLTPYVREREAEFIPSTLSSVRYDNKMWGVPRVTDAGFLYYRTDQVSEVPATWQAVYEEAEKGKGIVYQGASYEGLTVDFLELAFAAGGKVLSDDGTKAEFDNPQNLEALQFMVDGIESGAAPKVVTTYMEEQARRAFEAGRATFMRNWPYAYALAKQSKIADDFKVAPYPPFEGGGRAAILGGHNIVMSAYTKNPGAALKLLDYMSSEERIARNAVEYSKAPTLNAVYDDPAVQKAMPFAPELKQAVEQAKSRPVSPVYSQISQAIYENVNAALSGSKSPEQALKEGNAAIDKALATF